MERKNGERGRHPKISREKERTSAKGSRNGKRKPRDNAFFLQNTVKENGFEKEYLPRKKKRRELVSKILKAFGVFAPG